MTADQYLPDTPLTYTRGGLDVARQAEVTVENDYGMAPVVGQAGGEAHDSGSGAPALDAVPCILDPGSRTVDKGHR